MSKWHIRPSLVGFNAVCWLSFVGSGSRSSQPLSSNDHCTNTTTNARNNRRIMALNRDLKQSTTATPTRTPQNKTFNKQNNGCARAFWFFVHFLAVLCKTTTWNDQVLGILENVNDGALFFVFCFGIERWYHNIKLEQVLRPIGVLNRSRNLQNWKVKYKLIFF